MKQHLFSIIVLIFSIFGLYSATSAFSAVKSDFDSPTVTFKPLKRLIVKKRSRFPACGGSTDKSLKWRGPAGSPIS